MKYLVEGKKKALCRAGILVCDPDCLCVIFSFIRDEQPRVGLAGVCVCVDAGGGQWVREGVASLEMVNRIIKRAPVLPRRQK